MESTPMHTTNNMMLTVAEHDASLEEGGPSPFFASQDDPNEDQDLNQDHQDGNVKNDMDENNTSKVLSAAESETEDEEVKMNCLGGVRGMEESDICTTDDDDDDDDDHDDDDDDVVVEDQRDEDDVDLHVSTNSTLEEKGLVTFVTGNFTGGLIRPKATSPPHQFNLSPAMEEDEEDADSDSNANSDRSSVGARGVALSLGTRTPSAMTDDSDAEDEDNASSEEDDDDEDNDGEEDFTEEEKVELAKIQAAAARLSNTIDARSSMTLPDAPQGQVDQDQEDDTELDGEMLNISKTLEDLQDQDDPKQGASSTVLDHLLGVAKDREDFLALPKTKRVLSFNTLAMLNAEAGHCEDSPKRFKSVVEVPGSAASSSLSLPSFTLGPSAWLETPPASMRKRGHLRRESPVVSSSSDEDEVLEGQLREELEHASDPEDLMMDHGSSPVPLLTPPGSPLTIALDDGGTTTLCEWPSNLAVDSAMAAAQSRKGQTGNDDDDDDEDPCPDNVSLQESLARDLMDASISCHDSAPKKDTNCTLTPLLRGISVTLL